MSTSLQQIFAAIDTANQQDPNLVQFEGESVAKEHLYALRMSEQLKRFMDAPSVALQIACRAQHIKRWSIPRSDYPMDRSGYKKWRVELGKFHGELTASLMSQCGFDETEQNRVRDILQKKGLKRDPEVQTLEDIACLVFLQHHLEDFAAKHSTEKLISIIQKTWNKMSESGHQAALALPLSENMLKLIGQALAD